jgi:hypothetical protein
MLRGGQLRVETQLKTMGHENQIVFFEVEPRRQSIKHLAKNVENVSVPARLHAVLFVTVTNRVY